MSDGTKIVLTALKKIGAYSVAMPQDPQAISDGFDELKSMLELWESEGVDMGTKPTTTPGDDIEEPPDAFGAITDCLAIRIAPFFDNGRAVVSQELRANAINGEIVIKNLYRRVDIPGRKVSSTTPRGAGHQGSRYYDSTFFGDDRELES